MNDPLFCRPAGRGAVPRPACEATAGEHSKSGAAEAAPTARCRRSSRPSGQNQTNDSRHMPSPTRPCGRVPPLPRCGRGLENGRLQPLSCTAGEGAERSEAGEGAPVPSVRFAPLGLGTTGLLYNSFWSLNATQWLPSSCRNDGPFYDYL